MGQLKSRKALVLAPLLVLALVAVVGYALLGRGSSADASTPASITVHKTTFPSGDPQTFTVNLTGPVNQSGSVTDATDFVFTNLPSGTYTLTEVVPAGWMQMSFSCADSGSNMTFTLNPGDTKDCTYTNVKVSKIIVQKTTNPSGSAQTFPVTISGPTPGAGTISDSTDATFNNLMMGSYVVTETIPAGWQFVSVNCGGAETDTQMGQATVTVPPGQTVTCLFVNETTADFTVAKDFQPNNPGTVTVTVTCTSGTASAPDDVSEGNPLAFQITGFSGNPTCTATETNVPAGYQTSSCSAPLSAGGCTIVNVAFTPTPSPTPSPSPTGTVQGATQTPRPSGAVGGFVDVATAGGTGSSDGSLMLVLGALMLAALAGAAVIGFRRASIR